MADLVSIIIPVRNGEATIARCLEAAFASRYERFEVIVVNDGSDDRTAEIVKTFPCTLVQLPGPCGASRARNSGANHSRGDILFFTDADCLLNEDTLVIAITALTAAGRDVVLGGTYTVQPADDRFFSAFQSVFVNHAESRDCDNPDYIAAHAMVLYADTFEKSGGFAEDFLPILEDVDFSHRLRRTGHRLIMNPGIQVRHLFDYSLLGSACNGFRKSKYWTIYSIHNGDLLADSGTASRALKLDVLALFGSILAAVLALSTGNSWFSVIIAVLMALNITVNRELLRGFYRARGIAFAFAASIYYLLVYPLVVGAGGLAGVLSYRRYAGLLEAAG
ncbi:MAG: glycosyltransferase [Gammaproteobacteria bacterium]|nr:glycosyltransferase [Gammaproteobacteria bacterium]